MFLLLFLVGFAFSFNFYKTVADEEAIKSVLLRLPDWINKHITFSIEEDLKYVKDGARILPMNNGIFVQGGSGTTVLYAINFYLRNYCRTQITWDGNTYGDHCEPLFEDLFFEAPQVRFFGNPCTFSYTTAWWKWEDWENFIDWLAFNGFNMVLAPIGQEALWRDVFLDMGLDRRDLDSYFTGPAYLPWHRMGNLKGYGGPMTDFFLDAQLELNIRIVRRLASLGITPVLPTFAGFVPDALVYMKDKKWEKKFTWNTCWDGFNETYSCLASVLPKEDLFTEIGMRFMEKQQQAYGRLFHVYSADPMNEIPSHLTDIQYLRDLAWSVHAACMNGDNQCIWVLQSWTFFYDKWPKSAVKAFLNGVPTGRLLVLDLFAEAYPLYNRMNSFYQHAFVWSMLHNFGGNTEIRGNLTAVNRGYQIAKTSNNTMVGGGLTMEGMEQNYMVYQFMIDRMWSVREIQIGEWVENFVKSRYQSDNVTIIEAWQLIAESFYNQTQNISAIITNGNRFESYLFKRPKFHQTIRYWFDMSILLEIVEKFSAVKDALWHNHLFQRDYNDFNKELLQFRLGNDYITRIAEAIGTDDIVGINEACKLVQRTFEEIDKLANYDYDKWEANAISWASNGVEQKLLALNVRSLVSIWGPQGENLDYAHRSWKGLITKYYAPRWKFFCAYMANEDNLKNKTKYNHEIFYGVENVFVKFGRSDIIYN